MLVVALPLANPLDPEIRRFPGPPGEEWTDGVARRLEQEPELTREVLAQAVFSEIPRGADDDWLIVVCGDPDAASYGIVGGLRLLDVTNPRSFCDAALARAAGAS